MTEGRVRLSCGSADWQTAQSHPRVGTPIEVPLPSTVSVAFTRPPSSSAGSRGGSGLRGARPCVRHFHICHAKFVETVLQEILFCRSEIVSGLLPPQAERGNRTEENFLIGRAHVLTPVTTSSPMPS